MEKGPVMTIAEMKQRKKELGYTNEMIAERTGVPLSTVQKIFAGVTARPRLDTMEALWRVLGRDEDKKERSLYAAFDRPGPAMIRETAMDYGPAKETEYHTFDDYMALPDDRRVELIDGKFYDMASPTYLHQAILLKLGVAFDACVSSHPECELFTAPCDLKLDDDDYTVVQPDLFIVCDRKGPLNRIFGGAPVFALEILSPSTRALDLFIKLNKYRLAGVREYWIVDPDKCKVAVYVFEENELPAVYGFTDTIPVTVSNGECSIDFSKIYEKVKRYYD